MSTIFSQFVYSDALARNLGETYWRSLVQLGVPMRPWDADSYELSYNALRKSFDRAERIVLEVGDEESIVSVDRETGSLNLTLEVQDLATAGSQGQTLAILDSLFASLAPKFAWADADGEYPKGLVDAISNTSIDWIFWCNFYGAEYVKKYGLDFFVRAPFASIHAFAEQGVRGLRGATPGGSSATAVEDLRRYLADFKMDVRFYNSLV